MYYVYSFIDSRIGIPFYIGKGKMSYQRHKQHFMGHSLRRRYPAAIRISQIKQEGGNVLVEIIAEHLSERDAIELERNLISKWKRVSHHSDGVLVNKTLGGEGLSGWNHSSETRKKISRIVKAKFATGERVPSLKGKKNPSYKISPEARARLIAFRTGRPSWNRGKSYDLGRRNGKKSALTQSKSVSGRERVLNTDGTWHWSTHRIQWILKSPDGELFHVSNLRQFARTHKFDVGTIKSGRPTRKGWILIDRCKIQVPG
jgi:hypothetical protein